MASATLSLAMQPPPIPGWPRCSGRGELCKAAGGFSEECAEDLFAGVVRNPSVVTGAHLGGVVLRRRAEGGAGGFCELAAVRMYACLLIDRLPPPAAANPISSKGIARGASYL